MKLISRRPSLVAPAASPIRKASLLVGGWGEGRDLEEKCHLNFVTGGICPPDVY